MGVLFIGRAVAAVLVAFLAATGFCSVAAADEWSGAYRMEGVNPDGTEYGGRVRIERQRDGYVIEWRVGGSRYTGQAIASKRSLAAAAPEWVVIYEKADDGTLVGAWLPSGSFERGLERLIPEAGQ